MEISLFEKFLKLNYSTLRKLGVNRNYRFWFVWSARQASQVESLQISYNAKFAHLLRVYINLVLTNKLKICFVLLYLLLKIYNVSYDSLHKQNSNIRITIKKSQSYIIATLSLRKFPSLMDLSKVLLNISTHNIFKFQFHFKLETVYRRTSLSISIEIHIYYFSLSLKGTFYAIHAKVYCRWFLLSKGMIVKNRKAQSNPVKILWLPWQPHHRREGKWNLETLQVVWS